MKLSKRTMSLLVVLSFGSMAAHAQNDGFGNNPNWPINQGSDHQATPQADRNMQPNGSDSQWQAQHSNRPRYQPMGHGDRDQRYGYEKPKNPYNNGVNSANRDFRRGERLPMEYRGSRGGRYEVDDWHDHPRLYAPPPGMRWAYIDGRYILATIATGIIYNIIYGN